MKFAIGYQQPENGEPFSTSKRDSPQPCRKLYKDQAHRADFLRGSRLRPEERKM